MPLKTFHNKAHLFHLLTQETTALTPNNRLADLIIHNYFIHCKHQTVTKPKCMPYRIALTKAYEQLNFLNPDISHPTLLNSAQCQHLWRQIIKSESNITYSEGLLKSVISAWEHCQQWQLHPEDSSFHYTAQTRQFQQWWLLFEEQLKQLNMLTEHQIISYLLQTDKTLFYESIVWICFDDFTPQQVMLQQQLANKGIEQHQYDLQEKSSEIHMFSAADNKEEYQQLIAWLHSKLHEGNQRIGVVVPNLEQKSHSLQRMLAHHFHQDLFNLTLGHPLSNFPLVAHALCWLSLEAFLNTDQAYLLLQSPYLSGSKEEFIARSEYLEESSLLENARIPLKKLVEELQTHAPKLAAVLSKLTPYPQKSSINGWVHLFQERLNALGFPGDYGLTSENYQCFNRFMALFDELRQLALLHSQLSKTEAIEALQNLSNHTIFQAQKINAPIQISGLLEASGCEFDSLWVMDLTDQYLPQKVQLSAFIPPYVQRDLYMPHSLPQRELQFAKKMMHRLQRSANFVVLSYAQLQGDIPNLPCSLITEFPPFVTIPLTHDVSKYSSDLMTVEEHFNLPVLPEEPISGGSAILSNQAQCPFKAFAAHRLRAKVCPQVNDGLNHKERGQIIHKVMELLWQKLETQQKLLSLESSILEHYIEEAIHTTLKPLKEKYPSSFSDLIQEIECQRITQLVQACLAWEKQRPSFTVSALEQSYSINLAGLNIKVRVDRLDQVEESKWIIDYKSTLPTNKPWNEERPTESQLLLYALLDEQINTLLLLQLKAGKIYSCGFSEEKTEIKGIVSLKKDETWTHFRDRWKRQLTDLATEFQQGYCPPQPTHVTICRQCDFQNLCRFHVE